MEKQPLENLLESISDLNRLESTESTLKPWYNKYGDCIEFQVSDEAVVGDRIDKFLTIYRSASNDEPIGFQLKGVLAITRNLGCDEIHVKIGVEGGKLVSLTALLLRAFERPSVTIKQRSGYTQAIENLRQASDDKVCLATA